MCGIVGFVDFNHKTSKQKLEEMTDVLHHRGPDDSGYSFYANSEKNIGLGHRRLSVLDLSKHGHQPMSYEDLEIIYNGEVYNFREIRLLLEQEGYDFESDSDTEVILKAYHRWGIQAVDQFNGMFAISIYDRINQKITLIRDRAGVKPLYWYWKNNLFLFASELKSFYQHESFEKVINKKALGLYLQYGYVLEPHTIFNDTHKLKAGHYLEVDLKSKSITQQVYWDVIDCYNKKPLDISPTEAIDEMERLFKSAFSYRMVSDVPVGVFLSGGYDSSVVTAILQNSSPEKLNTFTIGFHEKGFDEAPFAKEVAKYLGTNHTEYYCTQHDALEIIPKLSEIYDEPFGDPSSIPTILVSQLAREAVTVSLSADGGDEIFAGYNKYDLSLNYFNQFSKVPTMIKPILHWGMEKIDPKRIPFSDKIFNFETKFEKVKDMLVANTAVDVMRYGSQHFTDQQVAELLKEKRLILDTNFNKGVLIKGNDQLHKMLAIDYKTYMVDDILTKVDRATMSISLEGREPLLDYRIIEFAAQLPAHLKYRNGEKKWLLKEITHRYLPKKLMDRPKKGFNVPIEDWFRDELKEYFLLYLNQERLEREGLFNADEVIRLRDKYLSGDRENVKRLWFILMFEMWYEKWI